MIPQHEALAAVQGALHIHSGIGMTDELALRWRFKGATMIDWLLGDLDWRLERLQRAE